MGVLARAPVAARTSPPLPPPQTAAARSPSALPQQQPCRRHGQQQQRSRHRQRRSLQAAAAGQNGNGNGSGNGSGNGAARLEEELFGGIEITPEEEAAAEAMLRDFVEGLGAGGLLDRPEDLDLPEGRTFTWEEANLLIGTSGWRLSSKLCPAVSELVTQMESIWRGVLPAEQFGVYSLPERFRYLDSLDPEGADPFAFRSLPDPEKGTTGYPRLQIENRAYRSRAFRKMHIEVAARQDGLQVFHCVLYPRPNFDLPILSMDVVANDGRVSLAIVDPCPVTPDLQLPAFYEGPIRDLQARYGVDSNRQIPEWGQAIFSPLCVIMRPQSAEELGKFLKYCLALTRLHVEVAKIAHPVPPAQRQRLKLLHAMHQRYCSKQLENDKTRRVLEAAFDAELAASYMKDVMFDCPALE